MFPNIEFKEIEELPGKLLSSDKGLMHSVMTDENIKDKGDLIKDSINLGVGSFTPDLMFEQIVSNYKNAERLYGPKIIRFLTGYEAMYVDRNKKIPEFQREIKKNIEANIDKLKKEGLIDKEGNITERATELASITLYVQELDNIVPKGISGERVHKKDYMYGEEDETKSFKRSDRYRDIAIKQSVKVAVRRKHLVLDEKDLRSFTRKSKGLTYVVYAMDCSGSMKGDKLDIAKKSGVALAFKAIDKKDMVGWIAFNDEIIDSVAPTNDFKTLLKSMTTARASRETNITKVIQKAVELFPKTEATKHIIILSDALPTVGKKPEEETLEAVAVANSAHITISMIGISLDKKGEKLAKKIVELGNGRLYLVKELSNIDKLILEDYYEVM